MEVVGIILRYAHADQVIVDRARLLPGKEVLERIKDTPARSSMPGKADLVTAKASVFKLIDGLFGLSAVIKDGHD